jgi:hypothetical protein
MNGVSVSYVAAMCEVIVRMKIQVAVFWIVTPYNDACPCDL